MTGVSLPNRILQISLFPALLLCAILAMYTRTNVVIKAINTGEIAALFSPAPAVAEAAPPVTAKLDSAVESKDQTAKSKPDEMPPAAQASKASEGDAVDSLTSEDVAVLQQLQQRRTALDQRQEQLDQREALLQATEKRLDDKIAQLQATRGQLQQLVGQMDEQQQAQVASMVKIYEAMKPAQAAAIFQQLEMPVLLEVLAKMKEAKASAIMAAMDPVKAKAVTTELMKKKDLPKLDPMPATATTSAAAVKPAAKP